MNPSLAAMIGRTDLVAMPGGGTMASASSAPTGSFSTSVSGDVSLGQTSLGMIAGMIVVLTLFYVWTRGRQA
jgi:hypothetical protein